ncbi:AraC family transcriptional regulator, partial [Mesorhizobium sp. M3A.F.Ca.ET.174.01.1.1]
MELIETLPRCTPQNSESAHKTEVAHVDIALFNGFALPKVAAIIEVFHK